MIGFFEHQYLSYKKNHMKNLLALAKADGTVHPREEKLLYKVGKRLGLKERQIKTILENSERTNALIPDNHNDRMNILYDLLLMIHADEKVEPVEVSFFEEAVGKFGMKREMVQWLLDIFQGNGAPSADEWEAIKNEAMEKFSLR